ncbi:MarR family winged helix-turn-helix transcriptional regulator [Rathayibacter festucae]|uniref:MarR family winged helix-turn-helix transcriptional regulator n=1 Tax=Rathayibacter festucae TaxID=110937 RepID=UPI002A69D8FC|nr:MarR family transcriptional regulator [Rathayibacter festucae]MDY0912920.1 MarR family transcriptional regulator [Rathayibacter festucae]
MSQQGESIARIELDTSVGYVLKEASSALRVAMEAALRPLGITVTAYSCLELLAHRPGLSSSELARGAFVTRQSMHVLLQAMERDGHLIRAETAPSGRALPIRLTTSGEELLGEASAAVRGVEERMLTGFDGPRIRELHALLRHCAEALG